tara:strand:- start:218 stop:550 length:333 start_codon:yes stop_codon:yes gene_type:complete
MVDKLNKLGLTEEERTVFYNDTVSNRIAELRYYNPVDGILKLHDPMRNTQIDFIWDSATSKWKGTGVQSGYTTEVSYETDTFEQHQLTPIVKVDDDNVPDKAVTVSRFPN